MKSPKFLVMDSHWREYDQDATPKSWGIPSAGLAYIIASVKAQGGEIVGVEQFFTEKKDRPASIQDFFQVRDTFISKGIEKAIHEHYGVTHFKWTDSTFTAREIDTRKTCEAIIKHGLHKEIQWLAYARIKEVLSFDASTLDLMKEAGCFGLHYGFETFDDSVLTGVKKGYRTIEEAREIVKRTRNAGIKITGSFMNGFPGQTQEALDLSVEYGIGLGLDVYKVHAAVPPIKQMERPVSCEVSSLFKIWNNDPNIPPNLFEKYTECHRDIFGMEDTLGRHTTSKQLASGVEPTIRHSAYNLSYSAEALLDSLVHFMENGRESIEYNLFFRSDMN